MAQDRRVHALVYFCGAVDDLFGIVFHGGLDMELVDMTIEFLSVAVLVAIVLGLLS